MCDCGETLCDKCKEAIIKRVEKAEQKAKKIIEILDKERT